MVQLLWKTVWRFIKKLNIELLYDLAIPLLGIYTPKIESKDSNRHLHANIHGSIIHNGQKVETT